MTDNKEPWYADRDGGEDWLKGGAEGWDLGTDVRVFIAYTCPTEESWRAFQTLPVFQAMPPDMKRQVNRFFYGTGPQAAAAARRGPGQS